MKKIVSISLVSVLLASCSFVPDFTRPSVPVPERWKAEQSVDNSVAEIPVKWWTLYNDPTLNGFVDEAMTQNLDIRAGFERVNQARSALRIAGASLLPSAAASMGASRTRTNPTSGPTSTSNSLTGGLAISYDLDLFGENRAKVEAARAALSGQQYTQDALRLVIQGEIANAYFGIITARERVRIAEDNLKNARDIMHIIQMRVNTGLDSDLELAQQRVAVSSSEAALASLKQQESTYSNALAVLLGRAPQTFDLQNGKAISDFPVPAIAPVQPSVLLERRPDIHSVEQSLMAANANIGAARSAFFPSIDLGGTASVAATSFGNPATTILALASSLSAPIFTGGALEGGLSNATSQQRELVETYRKTVLTAFQEVEDALAATKAADAREVALKNAVTSAKRAYSISRKRYDVGTIDFQTLLNTQASLLGAEDSYAQALEAKLAASVDLVKAMGGGWESHVKTPETSSTQAAPADLSPAAGEAVDAASDAFNKAAEPAAAKPVAAAAQAKAMEEQEKAIIVQ